MKDILYFDNAATTPVEKETAFAMLPYWVTHYGNASSTYALGREAREALECCRLKIADYLNCKDEGLYFTSGATESNNLLIKGLAHANKGKHIITSCIEHPSVLNTCKELEKEGYRVTYLGVNRDGRIKTSELQKAITTRTTLVTIMLVNNEIGTIQPMDKISQICKEKGVILHSDITQAVGHLPINIKRIGIDSFSASGHKFGAPKGIGMAYVAPGIKCSPLMVGGGQEKGMRAGTENVASVVGMEYAINLCIKRKARYMSKMEGLQKTFFERLGNVQYRVNTPEMYRVPNIISVSFYNVDGESLKLFLDTKGICVSTGSACHSGNSEPSHVLKAIDVPDKCINGTIRISFNNLNDREEVEYLADCIKDYLKGVNKNEISRE